MTNLNKKLVRKQSGLTNAGKIKGSLERLDEVERKLISVVQQIQKIFADYDNRYEATTRAINALVELVGREQVAQTVEKQKIEELEAESKTVSDFIEAEVSAGRLKSVETIDSENHIVVSTQKDASGKTLHPEKIQIPLSNYQPEVKTLLQGKKVGDSVTLPDASVVEILAIYEKVSQDEAI
jgi:hypothetical protein